MRSRELIPELRPRVGSPSREPPSAFDGPSNQHLEVVARNIDRACRRESRPERTQGQLSMDPTTLDAGAILHAPSDEEDPLVPPLAPTRDARPLALPGPPRTQKMFPPAPTATAA